MICRAGTAEQPIVVRGIPNRFGELPVISGSNAVVCSPLNYWGEERGVIKIGGANTPADTDPCHITIENLEVRSARPPYQYVGDDGATHTYQANAASIYIEKGHHLTIRRCILHDSGNGLFAGPYYGTTSNVYVEGCYIYFNGNTNSAYEHNNYTEADNILFEYNYFGPLRPGCGGNNLKDRSAGTVIRYNWIEGGNRQLDLVDTDYFQALPAYSNTYVYGNVLLEPSDDGNSQIVHYGGDSGDTERYRKGILHFFHNTIVSRRTGNTTLFRISSNEERVDCRNNIAYVTQTGNRLAMVDATGMLELRSNWFKTGWVSCHGSLTGAITNHGTLTGAHPNFIDEANKDYHLAATSACLDQASTSPLPLDWQYRKNQCREPRRMQGAPDLGAFEFPAAGSPADDLIFIHHSCGNNWLQHRLHWALLEKDYIDERNDLGYGDDVLPDAGRPDSLASIPGDQTDMRHWIRWFNDYLESVKLHGCANGTNRIIMFKSCYPLSNIGSDGTEPGDPFSSTLSIANYKAVYRHPAGPGGVYTNGGAIYKPLEDIFAANPDFLFIPVTAPPLHNTATTDANAHRARLFNEWLAGEWLDSYNAAHPDLNNVAVLYWFDYLANSDTATSFPNRLKAAYGGTTTDSHPNRLANTNSTKAYALMPDSFFDRAWAAFRHADYDGDQIADWWERKYAGTPDGMDGASDADADDQPDQDEYIAGTCPTNAQSRFEMSMGINPEAGPACQWPSWTNRLYTLRWTEEPDHAWVTLATQIMAQPPLNVFTGIPPHAPLGCLQVTVELPPP